MSLTRLSKGRPVSRGYAERVQVEGVCQVGELPRSCQPGTVDAWEIHHERHVVQGGPRRAPWNEWADET